MLKAKKTRSQMMLMEAIGGDEFNGEETRLVVALALLIVLGRVLSRPACLAICPGNSSRNACRSRRGLETDHGR